MILKTKDLEKYKLKTVLVDGCFDPLHLGHIKYFQFAAKFDLPVLCNVENDRYIKQIKRRPPLLPEKQRINVIDAIKYITYTHLQTTTTIDVLKKLQPIKYVKGEDWKKKSLPDEEQDVCNKYKIEIIYAPYIESSTHILTSFANNLKLNQFS